MRSATGAIEFVDLCLPHLPTALEGLRIAHLTDLHVSRPTRRFERLATRLNNLRVDLVVLTGDYMHAQGDEAVGAQILHGLCRPLHPRLGMFGVFGNHDTPDFKRRVADGPVRWLNNLTHHFDGLPLSITGFDDDRSALPDSVAVLLGEGPRGGEGAREQGSRDEDQATGDDGEVSSVGCRVLDAQNQTGDSAANPPHSTLDPRPSIPSAPSALGPRPLALLLSHFPNYLPVAADIGIDVMVCGHTHGGQCRWPGGAALINGTDMPAKLSAGILRHRDTIAVVSRGLGESRLPIRTFCARQLPIYTLRRGPLPGQATDHIVCAQRW